MKVKQALKQHIPNNSTLIVGLSGGPDSVSLLHGLVAISKEKHLKLIGVHIDHEWREDSGEDAQFCLKLCRDLGIQGVAVRGSTIKVQGKATGSQEDFGRQLRRTVFEEHVDAFKADAIVLAHHADDQHENFFIRLLRGTSIHGLVGMKPADGMYIRPFLELHKLDLLEYCAHYDLEYRVDSTNSSKRHLRNRVRQTVIPALKGVDDRFELNFHKTLGKLHDASGYIEREAQRLLKKVTHDGSLDLKKFLALDPFIQREVLIRWLYAHNVPFTQTERFIAELMRFIMSDRGGSHQAHENWRIDKKDRQASISR